MYMVGHHCPWRIVLEYFHLIISLTPFLIILSLECVIPLFVILHLVNLGSLKYYVVEYLGVWIAEKL